MHSHFLRPLLAIAGPLGPGVRVLDVGCGNGYTCGQFAKRGCQVVGVDLSHSGITLARNAYPQCRFETLSAEDDVLATLGEPPFDIVISTEVIEHLYAPREFVRACFRALKAGGRFVCTTPFHGYWKNVALSIAGRWDSHANPLWDGGHIKFWSRRTMTTLLSEAGFCNIRCQGAGRFPPLWMTMIVSATRPG